MEIIMESIWSQTVQIDKREHLPGDTNADVAVIGAGMAGLITAYLLKKQGKNVVVLEADRIAGGQTKNTTAKITSQHGAIYKTLIEHYGREKAQLYARANESAIDAYEKIIYDEGIDCHFKRENSYLYSTVDENSLKEELRAAASLGIKSYLVKLTKLPFPVKGAVCFPEQAQFHPLEFLRGISRDIQIYENTKALKVNGHSVITKWGTVKAQHIVFATHYPFPIVPGFYFARQHQERSYVLAIKGIEKWDGMYYCMEEGGLSLRWYEDVLLVGGGAHRTGMKYSECGYSALRRSAKQLLPKGEEVAAWAAQDCITHDELPLIGTFSVLRPYWYVATGLKKWGMTGSMISAEIISDIICGIENPYAKLFSPKRCHFFAARKKLWRDIKISMAGLKRGWLNEGVKRCSHNKEEGTWDCPCHGSRFKRDGSLIDNPAQTNFRKSCE